MNTPSHLIITAVLRKKLRRVPIPRSAFLFGSIMPDIPLYLLSFGGAIYYRFVRGMELGAAMNYMFDDLFFNDPFWIALHNFFHSPTLLLIALATLWNRRRQIEGPSRWLFWFFVACLLHTAIDIPTHVNDGPLLFFPFEWTIRFESPVSYWDSSYYGNQFAIFELALNIVLLGYLFGPALWNRLTRKRRDTAVPGA
ncbi:MAG: metal-dependent hydrolase [Chloroflexales bacterium]|nr:metal-dependent hydrolase [Chloroflexales bacterium]